MFARSLRRTCLYGASAVAAAVITTRSVVPYGPSPGTLDDSEVARPAARWDYNWDRRNCLQSCTEANREGEAGHTATNTAQRHLILIRHGHYDRMAPREKRYLTPLGRKQVEMTSQRLKALGIPVHKIVSSTMPRAQETGAIISTHFPSAETASCDLLVEGTPVLAEPSDDDYIPNWSNIFKNQARIEAAFRRYFHRAELDQHGDTYEVLACHSMVIHYLVCRALQLPPEAWMRFELYNGSITWLTIFSDGEVVMRVFNDTGYMPEDKLSLNC